MPKSHTKRNVFIAIALFVVTALAIFYCYQHYPALPPESHEIRQLRFSRTENAYFPLVDAACQMPPMRSSLPPHPDPAIAARDKEAQKLAIQKDFEEARPLLLQACKALELPHLLLPVDWQSPAPGDKEFAPLPLARLRNWMFEVGMRDAARGEDLDLSLKLVLAYYELDARGTAELLFTPLPNQVVNVELVRDTPHEFQRLLLEALKQLKAETRFNDTLFKNELRQLDSSCRRFRIDLTELRMAAPTAYFRLQSLRTRRYLLSHFAELAKVSTYTYAQYEEWKRNNPRMANKAELNLAAFSLKFMCLSNSKYLFNIDSVLLVLAIEQYRSQNGKYPDTLDVLAPDYLSEIPIDTFSGKPFHYRKEADDYYLYAEGKSDHDSGGARYNSRNIQVHLPPER